MLLPQLTFSLGKLDHGFIMLTMIPCVISVGVAKPCLIYGCPDNNFVLVLFLSKATANFIRFI